jgi:hypothetical protein
VRGQEAAFRACGRVLPFDRNPTAGKKQATWPYEMPAFGWDLSLYRDSRKFVIAIFYFSQILLLIPYISLYLRSHLNDMWVPLPPSPSSHLPFLSPSLLSSHPFSHGSGSGGQSWGVPGAACQDPRGAAGAGRRGIRDREAGAYCRAERSARPLAWCLSGARRRVRSSGC